MAAFIQGLSGIFFDTLYAQLQARLNKQADTERPEKPPATA